MSATPDQAPATQEPSPLAVNSFDAYAVAARRTVAPTANFIAQIVPDPLLNNKGESSVTGHEGKFGANPFAPWPVTLDRVQEGVVYANHPLILLLHGVMGLATEAGEIQALWSVHRHDKRDIDRANAKEELGDAFWYAALTMDVLGIDPRFVDDYITETRYTKDYKIGMYVDDFTIYSLELLEVVKKRLFYPKAIDDNGFWKKVSVTVTVVCDLCALLGFDPYDVMSSNLRKLQEARYKKGGFTTEEANVRDKDAEMAMVQGTYDGDEVVFSSNGALTPVGFEADAGSGELWTASVYQQRHPNARWYPGFGFREDGQDEVKAS